MNLSTSSPTRQSPRRRTNETPEKGSGEGNNTTIDESVVFLEVKKAPNFKPHEDVLLAKAYANVSTDPVNGTDQKSDAFWSSVLTKFNYLMQKLPKSQHIHRSPESLRIRWQRTLNKEVQLFNGCYSRLLNKNPSGWNEEKLTEEATKLYLEQSGHKEFKFEECYKILQVLPKFDPMRSSPEKSICAISPTNCDGKVMGEGMERPIGAKKAKKMMMIKQEYEEVSVVDSLNSFQNSMVEVNNRLVDVLERKQRHDIWMKQAQFYQAIGDTALAMQYMKKIEMDEMGAQKKARPDSDKVDDDDFFSIG